MPSIIKAATTLVMLTIAGPCLAHEPVPANHLISPIAGPGEPTKGRTFLLNLEVGAKQAVAYFQNDNGRCKTTLMVADRFNGEDVPNLSTVRYEATIAARDSARFSTAEGNALEFRCAPEAASLDVSVLRESASN